MNVVIYLAVMLPQTILSFKYIPEDDTPSYTSKANKVKKSIAKAEDIPYHVVIVYGGYYCSGALVQSRLVLTTASCFARRSEEPVFVKAGANTITAPGQVTPVLEVKIHEYYGHASAAHNDIALLLLQYPVLFMAEVKKIYILDPDVALRIGTTIEVSGWGYRNLAGKYMNKLIWSDMVVISNEECVQFYNRMITPSSFCAKYQIERRLSDNGGPAIYRKYLVGLLSFGGASRKEPHVAVFTNVSYFHRWISLNTERFTEKYCNQEDSDETSYSEEGHLD